MDKVRVIGKDGEAFFMLRRHFDSWVAWGISEAEALLAAQTPHDEWKRHMGRA